MERTIINGKTLNLSSDSPLNMQFSSFQSYELNVSEVYQEVNSANFNEEIVWNLGNQTFAVHLYAYDIRHPDYTLQISTESGIQELDPGPSYTYRGWNLDDPSKEVRMSITPTYIAGFITDVKGVEWYIQPAIDFGEPLGNAYILYQGKDVVTSEPRTCGTDLTHAVELPQGNTESHSRSAACVEAEVAIAADYSMYTKYGKNAQSLAQHLIDVKNLTEPNYSVYNVEFKVITTLIETASGQQGWSNSTSPGTLLNSYCCWAGTGSSGQLGCTGQNGFGVAHDVGELWSNRDFDGSTVGIAWLGTICNTMFRYSTNQHFTTSLQSLRCLIAHETGHNFGANHDAAGTPYIMAPSVNPGATTWSSASQSAINTRLPTYSCLGACSTGGGNCASNITVTSSNATGNKVASNKITTSGTINLNSNAMYNAPEVQVGTKFTVPSGITFEIRSSGCNP